jgi:hypothetical protein
MITGRRQIIRCQRKAGWISAFRLIPAYTFSILRFTHLAELRFTHFAVYTFVNCVCYYVLLLSQ